MNKFFFVFLLCTAAVVAQTAEPPGEQCPSGFAIGAAVGSPAGLSVTGAFLTEPVSFRISGGAWGKNWYGVQAAASWTFFRGEQFSHGLSLLVGRFGTQTYIDAEKGYDVRSESYVGAAYDMNLGGFYLEAGLGLGPGAAPGFPNPVALFQAGYLVRL
jgi:hypothetical protein